MSFESAIERLAASMEALAASISETAWIANVEPVAGHAVEPEKPKRGRPAKAKEDSPALTDSQIAASEQATPAAPAAPASITPEALRAACKSHAQKHGGDATRALVLRVGGAEKTADVKPENLPALYAALTADAGENF